MKIEERQEKKREKNDKRDDKKGLSDRRLLSSD